MSGRPSGSAAPHPLRVAISAAWANAVPMAALWAAGVLAVLAWYFVPSAQAAFFQPVARFQTAYGQLAAFANRMVFGGLLPGVFLVAVKSLRPRRLWTTIVVNCVWAGIWGMIADRFFALQSHVFGDGVDMATLTVKVVVDKCIWSGCLCVPANSVFFFWEGRDFSIARVRAEWPRGRYWRDMYLPVLIADWMLWIPVQYMVYQFPLVLQNQLVGMAGALWVLVGLAAGARLNKK